MNKILNTFTHLIGLYIAFGSRFIDIAPPRNEKKFLEDLLLNYLLKVGSIVVSAAINITNEIFLNKYRLEIKYIL